jgi:CubicO group peptidase (beta-lactamase class C family)
MNKALSLLALALLFLRCETEVVDVTDVAGFDFYAQSEMDRQHIPALSVLIFREDSILLERYYGQSNLQQNLALTSDHLFLLASVSKVVTATALLQLYEDGQFDLDDPINDHLPFDVYLPDFNDEITFRHLLTHTSGIDDGPSLDGQYYYNQDPPVSLRFFLENYLAPGGQFYDEFDNFYSFRPGSRHQYSNTGAALIGLLVEEISGTDFNTYCKQNIFTPLGMTNTAWRLDEINQVIVTPYDYYGGINNPIQQYTFTDYPNGGLRSTAQDLFKFLQAFVMGGMSNNVQLLNPSTINAMISAQIPSIDNSVGLHMFVMNAENNLWGHDGGEQGVATIMAFNPGTKVGVIILSNQGEANLDEILEVAYKLGLLL